MAMENVYKPKKGEKKTPSYAQRNPEADKALREKDPTWGKWDETSKKKKSGASKRLKDKAI